MPPTGTPPSLSSSESSRSFAFLFGRSSAAFNETKSSPKLCLLGPRAEVLAPVGFGLLFLPIICVACCQSRKLRRSRYIFVGSTKFLDAKERTAQEFLPGGEAAGAGRRNVGSAPADVDRESAARRAVFGHRWARATDDGEGVTTTPNEQSLKLHVLLYTTPLSENMS